MEGLKKTEKAGYLVMAMTINIAFSFKNVYYLLFLTNVLCIPVGIAGILLVLGTVWDAVNDPLIGLWVANHRFSSGEKARPILLRASVPWAVTLVLLFFRFNAGQTATILICLGLYFLFEICYTFVAIPYTAMPSLASASDADRKAINACRGFGAGIGSGIGAVAIVPMIKLFGGLAGENAIIGVRDSSALLKTSVVMGLICLAGGLIHYFTSRERIREKDDGLKSFSLIQSYRMLFKSRSWVLNTLYFLFYGVCNVLTMTVVSYYASYVLGATSMTTPILAAFMVMYVAVAVMTPSIDRHLGRRKTMIVSLAIQIVTKIPFLIWPHSLVCILINAAGCGIGGSMIFIIAGTNRSTIADILELKSGRRMDSMVASGENLLLKLLEALVQWVITFVLALAGFEASKGIAQNRSTISTICNFLGIVPLAICFVSVFVVRKLDIQRDYGEQKARHEAGKV